MRIVIFLALLFFVGTCSAQELKTERDYQLHLNKIFQGKVEHRLQDNTRVDILTDDLAIEVDFASKWFEGIGQALHYAALTNKTPAVILIVENDQDEKYVTAALNVARKMSLKLSTRTVSPVIIVYKNVKEN